MNEHFSNGLTDSRAVLWYQLTHFSNELTDSSVMLPTYIIFRPNAYYMPNLRPNTQKRVKLNKAFVNKKSI